MTPIKNLDEIVRTLLPEPRTMVQLYILTINGVKHLLVGPVIHIPEIGLLAGDIQELEFGEVMPAEAAARLFTPMDGGWTGGPVS